MQIFNFLSANKQHTSCCFHALHAHLVYLADVVILDGPQS
jgi:hypothetical protein